MAKRPSKLTEHEPLAGAQQLVANVASILSGEGSGIPAKNIAGTGFMQLGPTIASALAPAGALPFGGGFERAASFVPGIADPTGFELDPLGRGNVFATGQMGALPRLPVADPVAAAPGVVTSPPVAIPTVANLANVAVPGVADPTTRSVEELQNIAGMLAPNVEAGPLTREQLIGGDVFGLTAAQVQDVTATRMSQLATKASTDKQALDFLRKSTGVDQAEGLVKDKIREEGDIARAKFAADTQAQQSAIATNRQIELERWKAKTDLTNRLLVTKAEAAAEATMVPSFQDQWKEQKAQGYLELYQTNPQAALGLARLIEPEDIRQALEADKVLPTDSPLRMDEATHRIYSQILSQGVVPEGGE